MIVAIDGPAGAGKSTVARQLAARLGFRYLDTGAMYRALTWLALESAADLDDAEALGALAREHPISFEDEQHVLIDGRDVSAEIREPRIDKVVSSVARHPQVREVMRERQRELGEHGNVVIEGRDIGTVVAPDADVKVYLNADQKIRAERRQAERPDIGGDALATDLRLRDESDAARMQPAENAERIDTTELDVEDVVDRIELLVRARV
jgi:CMP/dCMP kinase